MVSQSLGNVPSNNEAVYRKIANAIWLSDKQFDKIKQQAIQEHFWLTKWAPDFDYALSSKYWDTPEAMQELKNFAQFIDQKYWIKK